MRLAARWLAIFPCLKPDHARPRSFLNFLLTLYTRTQVISHRPPSLPFLPSTLSQSSVYKLLLSIVCNYQSCSWLFVSCVDLPCWTLCARYLAHGPAYHSVGETYLRLRKPLYLNCNSLGKISSLLKACLRQVCAQQVLTATTSTSHLSHSHTRDLTRNYGFWSCGIWRGDGRMEETPVLYLKWKRPLLWGCCGFYGVRSLATGSMLPLFYILDLEWTPWQCCHPYHHSCYF